MSNRRVSQVKDAAYESCVIRQSRYKDQPAITLESGLMAAQFLPATGAKMCSLRFKPANLELLLQRPMDKYRLAPYDGDYVVQGECSGFDEMFPSIDRCFYEGYPWRGTPIPDHGEVWSIPWTCAIEDHRPGSGHNPVSESLHFAVHGVRFPYQLEKWVSFVDGATLRTDYRLTNLSDFDLDFMWAAHMMLNLEEGATLLLPDSVNKIVTALSFDGGLGRYGDEFDWPVATLRDGRLRDLRQMQPKTAHDVVKYFVKGKLSQGWCKLTYPGSGCALQLSWPAEQAPYLAILPDEGGWQDLYSIFIEPATSSFDRLDAARARGELSTVKARATYAWHLELQVA